MENTYQNDDRYYSAKKQIEEIKEFYGNLASYLIFNSILLVVNLVTSPDHLWFYWPLFGWGIGVLIHGMRVFNYLPFFGKDWEEQKIKKIMDEENKKNWE